MSGPVAQSKKIASKLDQIEADNVQGVHLPEVPLPGGKAFITQPAQYFERDEYDDVAKAKNILTNDPILGNQVTVTEKDIQYLLDQRKKEELYQYDDWFYKTFKFGADPNKVAVAKKMNPEWFSRRSREISKQIEICKKLAKLSLRGPQSQEDVMTLYALDQGRISIPNLDLLFPEKAKAALEVLKNRNHNVLQQGYFNPRVYIAGRTLKGRTNLYDDVRTSVVLDSGSKTTKDLNQNLGSFLTSFKK